MATTITGQLTLSASSAGSSSVNFIGLPTASSLDNILVYNTASGQLSYTSSAAIGGGGSGTPGGSDTYIQFNNAGVFDGAQYYRYLYESKSLEQGNTTQAIGQYSHAEGQNNQATGDCSHAEGANTTAVGDWSHAEGDATLSIGTVSHAEGSGTQAVGDSSHAEGYYTISSGLYSHAEGRTATASGSYSHAEGSSTIALGQSSHAEGDTTLASGDWSHAEGYSTISSGSYSHAEGNATIALGSYSHTEGNGTQAMGDSSHAEGFNTYAGVRGYQTNGAVVSGVIYLDPSYGDVTAYHSNEIIYADYNFSDNYGQIILSGPGTWSFDGTSTTFTLNDTSINSSGAYIVPLSHLTDALGADIIIGTTQHTEGYATIASGFYSHAEGANTLVVGDWSHAEGSSTRAVGDHSHAEGADTQAIGQWSHAEGQSTQAIGGASHAEGYYTQAIGAWSHAEGNSTIASGSYQTVVGTYNSQSNATSKLIVGIGNSTTRKDGFTVDVDANLSGSIMIPTNTSNPSNPKAGSMYYNTSTNRLHIYNGTAWKSSSFS